MILALPLAIPLLAAVLTLLSASRPGVQQAVSIVGAAALLGAGAALLATVVLGGPVSLQVGGWPSGYGVGLRADALSATMVVLSGLTGLATVVYGRADVEPSQHRHGHPTLVHVLLLGVTGSFLTADLFNLYVWFEVMLMASFVLVTLGGGRAQLRGALAYLVINLVSSSVFLLALGGVYGATGTLDLTEVGARLGDLLATRPEVVTALAAALLLTFGVKAGLFPLYAWLPPAYPAPPVAVSALFAGLLTKVGVYALLRVFAAVLPDGSWAPAFVGVVAMLTMGVGVLGAVAQGEVRRILSYHIVSQIGYMVAALGIFAVPDPELRHLAVAAAVFYIVHHIVVKANLFLVSGAMEALGGSTVLTRTGGLARSALLAALFGVPALSLAGIPPFSGFWAKLAIIDVAIRADQWAIAVVAAGAGVLTVVSMAKIWTEAFWKPHPTSGDDGPLPRLGPWRALPMGALALITVAIGLFPQPLFSLADIAATHLLAGGPP